MPAHAHCAQHALGCGVCPACQRACQALLKAQLEACQDARAAWALAHPGA